MNTEQFIDILRNCSKGICAWIDCPYYRTDGYVGEFDACHLALMNEAAEKLEDMYEAVKELDQKIHNIVREIDANYIKKEEKNDT